MSAFFYPDKRCNSLNFMLIYRLYCLSVYQSTNLNAIHNIRGTGERTDPIVYQYIKVQIWMQYTTVTQNGHGLIYCLSVYQSTNLNAIHNMIISYLIVVLIVYQYIKVQIWMQYTTGYYYSTMPAALFISISKYKFECNTQHIPIMPDIIVNCLSVYQSTNLNAIHNSFGSLPSNIWIVYQYIKVQIWMQYTTCSAVQKISVKLFISISKYKFECNTQRLVPTMYHSMYCLSVYQSTNLNAIHNLPRSWNRGR